MAAGQGLTSGAVIRGVRWADLAARKPLWQALDEKSIQNFKTGEQVLMGHLAQTLGVNAGDTITLVGARGRTTPFGTLPQRRSYKIGGVF